jgi:pimeloyl-ACP methyl ester carboxylesterase
MDRRHDGIGELRGATRLALDATTRVVDLVEAMHCVVGGGPLFLGRPFLEPTRALSAPVFASVRSVVRAVGVCVDAALVRLAPAPSMASGLEHDTVLAVLNGILGDHLVTSDNPLAIRMQFRREGYPLELDRSSLRVAYPDATEKVLVLVHGSCRHDRSSGGARDPIAALAHELGFTPVHLLYNTGQHIATNGREFAALLERLVTAWPVSFRELAIVGHSMGGLVARSACHVGEAERQAWRSKLRNLVCIASPHHGAPLERGGHWVEVLLRVSRYSAPFAHLGRIRSAGVTDMRFGYILDEHRDPGGRFAHGDDIRRELKLPHGVRCYAIAGTRTTRPGGKLAGDGLVPVDSALGRHRKGKLTLAFADTWVGLGMGHTELLERSEVHAVLRSWLSARSGECAETRSVIRSVPSQGLRCHRGALPHK